MDLEKIVEEGEHEVQEHGGASAVEHEVEHEVEQHGGASAVEHEVEEAL